MSEINPFNQEEESLVINEEIKGYLLETCRWTKFMSILGYIGVSLMVLGGLISMVDGGLPEDNWISILYVILAIVYYIPINYLFQFSNDVKQGLISNYQESLSEGLGKLRSHFKFVGIFTIVIISLYLLVILYVIIRLASK